MEIDRIEKIEGLIDKLIKDKAKELYPNMSKLPNLRYIEDENLKTLLELRAYIEIMKDTCKDTN